MDILMRYVKTHPWITFELDLRVAPVRFWTLLGGRLFKVRSHFRHSSDAGDCG